MKPKISMPALVFLQEVKPGDILKHKAQSNVATSGGGARDLRMPDKKFRPILSRIFTDQGSEDGVLQTNVHSVTPEGTVVSKVVEFWRPAQRRFREARIGKINEIEGWRIDESQYDADLAQHKKTFFLLTLDKAGVVWARTLREEDLPKQDQKVREYIQRRIKNTPEHETVRGSIDFETGHTYPD